MASVNKVILVGNLGKDPETRYAPSGDAITNITLATTDSWKDKATGENREKSDWHDIVIWNPHLAEVAEKYVRKGALIGVEGKLEKRKWEKDGVERWSTEVVLTRFRGELTLLARAEGDSGGRGRDSGDDRSGGGGGTPRGAQTRPGPDLDDDIPFNVPWA